MEIRESVTFEEVYGEATTIWYSAGTCWWTHRPEDVREATILSGKKGSQIPLDPFGSPLFYAEGKAKDFLDSARQNLDHYGRHGLRAFMAAHHRNVFDGAGKPTASKSWDDYNSAIDRFDSRALISAGAFYQPVVPPPVYDDHKIIARCVICNAEFTEAGIAGAKACPKCGEEGLPASPDQDVTVKINWHELRILCIWAEHYANSIANTEGVKGEPVKSVWAIAGRLQEQYPSFTPLTLSGEIGQVREKYPDMEVQGIREGGPLPPKVN